MSRARVTASSKVAVTGGSSGIGLACALEYVKRGCDVAILARDLKKLDAARETLLAARSDRNSRVLVASVDLTDEDACAAAFAALRDEDFDPDVLINSAGIINPGEFCTMSSKQFSDNIDFGFWTVVNPCRVIAPRMKERGSGYIVNVSSVAGYMGVYGYTGYSAAKFATMGFTESLRCELAADGVSVSVVCPPDTDTPALARERTMRPPETDAIAGNLKAVSPAAIAKAVVAGVDKGAYLIIPGAVSKLYFRIKGIFPEVVFAVVDSDVRKTRKKTRNANR